MNVTERFLRYVAFDTTSSETSGTTPSTASQLVLADFLAEELRAIGLSDVRRTDTGYVYGVLPATPGCEAAPTVGYIAHMDTSPAVSGHNIRPRRIHYTGGDIPLNDKVSLRVSDFPFLEKYRDQDWIVTDGTTLLGADDKAGVAEIVSACAYLAEHPALAHGRIAVGFTPDEEIGCGADHFDLAGFDADWAYTVDGGELGEIEYENFNAAGAVLTVNGVNIHPGSAKNKMKNAVLLATEWIAQLPPAETPAHTEGYEGFYHVDDIRGNETQTTVQLIVRDHDRARFEARKAFLQCITDYLNTRYGADTFVLTMRDSYYNMKEKVLPFPHIIAAAEAAMRACDVTPQIVPIRGGTDGARLSYEGLPCPNLSTGGFNFHGVHECIPVSSLETMTAVLIQLMTTPQGGTL